MSVPAKRERPLKDINPAELGYPPTLPLELALRTASTKEICESYGIDKAQWDKLRHDPALKKEVADYLEDLKTEGVSFKMKARLQSEELLKTSWKLIHSSNDQVPPNVKADLIKFTVRAAGLDGSKDQVGGGVGGNSFQININLA